MQLALLKLYKYHYVHMQTIRYLIICLLVSLCILLTLAITWNFSLPKVLGHCIFWQQQPNTTAIPCNGYGCATHLRHTPCKWLR